ncbi:3-oxoacyl-ACP synthase III family protein [Nocardia sp. NPDC059177]|uniref:3-oxoacyl-ACP synthase III family protein n=1 Tax=Nocardia sp. NPDC059177 TaxID=3346759 RepID=UPI0036A2348C
MTSETLAVTDRKFGAAGLTRPVGVMGSGVFVPDRVVPNDELVHGLDTSDEWIIKRTGIRERRFLGEGLATSDMCIPAARQALRAADVRPEDLAAVIVATFTPDQPLPSTALVVKNALGADNAIPLDLTQVACAGPIYAMLTAAHLLQNETAAAVLVIGADCGSRATNPTDRTTRVFLGDAAGAVVLGRTETGYGLLSWDTGDDLSFEVQIPTGGSRRPADAERVVAGEHFLHMNGRAVWNIATTRIPQTIRRSVRRAGLEIGDVRHFLLHQANLNIINEAMSALELPADKAPSTVGRYGNTGAASMFTVLHEAMESGLDDGDVLVLAAIGAGFLWGSMCIRHNDIGHGA